MTRDNKRDPVSDQIDGLLEYREGESHFEPLDDLARHRMVEEILSEKEARDEKASTGRTRFGTALIAASIIVVAAGAGIGIHSLLDGNRQSPQESVPAKALASGVIVLTEGEVLLDGVPTGRAGVRLGSSSTVETRSGFAAVNLPTGITMYAKPGTEISIDSLDIESISFSLSRGEAIFFVSTRRLGPPVSVRTEAGTASVTGTVFSVNAGEQTTLRVFRGSVEVSSDGLSRRGVGASKSTVFGKPEILDLSVDEEDEALSVMGKLDILDDAEGTPICIESVPPGAEVNLGDISLGSTPLTASVRVGHRNLDVSMEGFAPVRERIEVVKGIPIERVFELRRVPGAATEALAPLKASSASKKTTKPPSQSARTTNPSDLLREAQEHLARRHWSKAASSYHRLVNTHAGTPEARTACVSLANLELRHLGNPTAALALYERYLSSGGPLAPEASWGRVKSLESLGRKAEVIRSLERFLESYPSSLKAPLARAKLAELRAEEEQ